MLMISVAHAQSSNNTQNAAPAAQGQPGFGLMNLMPFAIIFFIFYFLLIRPQKKKMEKEQAYLNQIKKGDEIYTRSGILGTIVGLNDKLITLDVGGGVQFKVLRSQVAGDSKSILNPAAVSADKK